MGKRKTKLEPAIKRQLARLERQLNFRMTYQRIYDGLLTDAERRRVQRSRTIGPNIVDIWAKLKRIPRTHAIVFLSWKMGAITLAEFKQLAKRIGMKTHRRARTAAETLKVVKPCYQNGGLKYRDVFVRKVYQCKSPSMVQTILETFQRRGWPRRIRSPFADHVDPQKTDKVVYRVNHLSNGRDLDKLQFGTAQGGKFITWAEKNRE